MRSSRIALVAVLAVLVSCAGLAARPMTAHEAEMVVTGWLKTTVQPLGMTLGRRVVEVGTFTGQAGSAAYHIVSLDPSGFVIVSADDSLEPIIGFADDGYYDPSSNNPLGALVTSDLNGRAAAGGATFGLLMDLGAEAPAGPQGKWRYLIDLAANPTSGFGLMSLTCISDIRVTPLVQSRWGQADVCGLDTYNYYTPNQYPCGCTATALAQVMLYHQHPTESIGVKEFTVEVGNTGTQTVYTRGSNGLGAPYNWNEMVLRPASNCSALTESQRQAIGAICYDAGIAVGMTYEPTGSGSFLADARDALITTFHFGNAVHGYNLSQNIHSGLNGMINPNLDAGYPVVLAILDVSGVNAAHAVVCDGYGYDSQTLYHHLNMGWEGIDDVWYNLPDIDGARGSYSSIFGCIYNIFPSGSGEIISGRVLDPDGRPIANVRVLAEPGGRFHLAALTDDRGIYALEKVNSNTFYTLQPVADGYVFSSRSILTSNSRNDFDQPGNRWGVDFYAEQVLDPREPAIIYVAAAAVGYPDRDGSIQRPFGTIQRAIDVAVSGDTVILLSGVYSGDGNRDLDFKGKSITVRGEDPNEPHLVIIDCNATEDDPHRGFDFHSYETPEAVLDGVTITGGYHTEGGGIYCSNCATPTVINCVFSDNRAVLGGAMYVECSPTLTNCIFSDNSADGGGGLYNNGGASDCNPVLVDCAFTGNAATQNGGAVYNLGRRARPTLTGCDFIANSVSEGGGGAMRSNVLASPTLANCLFADNSAAMSGGAIRNSNGGSTKLTNCTFSANSASNGTAFASTPDDGDSQGPCVLQVVNCILWDGGDEIFNDDGSAIDVKFSNIRHTGARGSFPGEGNLDAEPHFADPDGGNYHLKSQAGRWDTDTQSWVLDETTSPCIDAGDALMAVGAETVPNGGVINMGVFGGTALASRSSH